MKLGNLEKVEGIITKVGYLTLKNVVTLGKSHIKNKSKMDFFYEKEYSSNKYSDIGTLKSIVVDSADFLVLSYSDRQNKLFEEVYLSYPHIWKLEELLSRCINLIESDKLFFYNDRKELLFDSKYNDLVIGVNDLVSNKEIWAIFDVILDNNKVAEKGIVLFINSDLNYIELNLSDIKSLYYIIRKFDLYAASQTLINNSLLINMNNELTDNIGSIDNNNNNTDNNNNHIPSRSTSINRRRTSTGRRVVNTNDKSTQDKSNMNKEVDEVIESEVEDTIKPSRRTDITTNRRRRSITPSPESVRSTKDEDVESTDRNETVDELDEFLNEDKKDEKIEDKQSIDEVTDKEKESPIKSVNISEAIETTMNDMGKSIDFSFLNEGDE